MKLLLKIVYLVSTLTAITYYDEEITDITKEVYSSYIGKSQDKVKTIEPFDKKREKKLNKKFGRSPAVIGRNNDGSISPETEEGAFDDYPVQDRRQLASKDKGIFSLVKGNKKRSPASVDGSNTSESEGVVSVKSSFANNFVNLITESPEQTLVNPFDKRKKIKRFDLHKKNRKYRNSKITLDSSLVVTEDNELDYMLSGSCEDIESFQIVTTFGIDEEINCSDNRWSLYLGDLSFLSSKIYRVVFYYTTENEEFEEKEMKLTYPLARFKSKPDRYLVFNKKNFINFDLASREFLNNKFVTFNEENKSLTFSKKSNVQLHNGTIFNREFSKRTYYTKIRLASNKGLQFIIDEGGSTNGLSLVVEKKKLALSVRSGTEQDTFRTDFKINPDEDYEILVSFNEGEVIVIVNEEEVLRDFSSFSTIPTHSDLGGIGKNYGTNSFINKNGKYYLRGDVYKFISFNDVLDKEVIKEAIKFYQRDMKTINFGKIGLELAYNFDKEDPYLDHSGLGNNLDPSAKLSLVEEDTFWEVDENVTSLNKDGFLNNAFKQRTIGFKFIVKDYKSRQYLYDEGGSTHGLSIYLDKKKLFISIVKSRKVKKIKLGKYKKGNLYKIDLIYDNGILYSYINDKLKKKVNTKYGEIPYHGDSGGFGGCFGASAVGETCSKDYNFNGYIKDNYIYSRALQGL